jgi:hypothetical protein
MDIRNATQFANFISQHGLASLHPTFQQVVTCIHDYSVACNCHANENKATLYNNCNNMYNSGATVASTKFRSIFLSKIPDRIISFFNDSGKIIAIASR